MFSGEALLGAAGRFSRVVKQRTSLPPQPHKRIPHLRLARLEHQVLLLLLPERRIACARLSLDVFQPHVLGGILVTYLKVGPATQRITGLENWK